MLKKIGFFLLFLVVAYLILCAMGPKNMNTTVSKTINAPVQAVFSQISEFKNWPNWSAWHKRDPEMKITYGASTSGVGGSYSWTSPNSQTGTGSMETKDLIPNQKIVNELTFKDFNSVSNVTMDFKDNGNKTTDVTWTMNSEMEMPFFMRGMILLMGGVKKDFEACFTNLNTYFKEHPEAAVAANGGFTVQSISFPEKNYISKRATLSFDKLSSFFATEFANIGKELGKNKIQMSGYPTGIYWMWDEKKQTTDVSVCMPVPAKTPAINGFINVTVPAAKALCIDYYGGYERMAEAHKLLGEECAKQNITIGTVLEEYIVGPNTEKDTAKWLTKINYISK